MSKSSRSSQLPENSGPPESILIIGSGAFGLSAALELSNSATYKSSKITLVDRLSFPAPDGASIDTSRLVRADYADPAYATLAEEAQKLWRAEWGAENRYHETGILITAEPGREAYVLSSLENVRALEAAKKAQSAYIKGRGGRFDNDSVLAIEALPTPQDITRVSKTPGASGYLGYINRRSGWVDAEAAMRYLRQRVESLHRVVFVQGTVQRLVFSNDGKRVLGARLAGSNQILPADLTVLAAGAWTPTLLDLRGILQATGQVLAYVPVSDAEALALSQTPCQINMSTGLFVIPPPAPSQHIPSPSLPKRKRLFLKIARHAPGYSNVTTIPHPEIDDQDISVSVPHTNPTGPLASQPLPAAVTAPLRAFLTRILQAPDGSSSSSNDYANIASRPFELTRLCHYADTPTGDFLLDYHPSYGKTLFVASGGSGHAFKFLPVLGRCVVECLREECRGEFRGKWTWRERASGAWSTQDGSRASDGLQPLPLEGVDQRPKGWTKL